jgi:methyl-accepting chemotaxis protein
VDSLSEISTAMQEISTTVQANAKHANETMRVSGETKILCEASSAKLQAVSESVESIDASTRELTHQIDKNNAELNRIKDFIQEINKKVNVINEIAFQTKLLSFNASVEAARAGEAGKGFAVVAQEVGNLAKMSGDSAGSINKLLLESMAEVSGLIENSKARLSSSIGATNHQIQQSLFVTNESREKLSELQEAVSHVEMIANQVAEAAVQQERGVADVNEAILRVKNEIDKVNLSTSKTDATMRQLEEATDGITESVQILKGVAGLPLEEREHEATEKPESPQWTQDKAS